MKKNAIAGRRFASWAAMEAHLHAWVRDVADARLHGTTGEVPLERFRQAEAAALRPITGVSSFQSLRELTRRVQADCAIEVDGNSYSVPWRLIGERVRVAVTAEALRVSHAGHEVAVHARRSGRHQRIVVAAHFAGVAGFETKVVQPAGLDGVAAEAPALLRPLAEYEALVGGGF
ncbi:hypothetical protein AEGHOMDF_0411 [Methylobacterium soli]|nr:hypothetical protein AEGHOMDF_0411 [Methylobacterium soli]